MYVPCFDTAVRSQDSALQVNCVMPSLEWTAAATRCMRVFRVLFGVVSWVVRGAVQRHDAGVVCGYVVYKI